MPKPHLIPEQSILESQMREETLGHSSFMVWRTPSPRPVGTRGRRRRRVRRGGGERSLGL